jgi:predicted DNA-binding protein YlxM (UPF0122 family)
LRNPEISSAELLNNVYNYLTTKESGPNYLKSVIRGYSGLLTEQIDRYLSIFFKPKFTVSEIITSRPSSKIFLRIENALEVLVELETYITMNPEFNLDKELKKAIKEYNKLTKGKTKKEQIRMRRPPNSIKKVELAYYKKRILENYEEYKRAGRISEPIFDSPQEINAEQIKNLNILKKGLLHEIAPENASKTKKLIAPDRTKTRKKSQTVLKNLFGDEHAKLIEKLIKKGKIDMKTKEGRDKLLKMLQDMGKK